MKNRIFFKDVSQETWDSKEFQQDLKKRDDAEHRYEKPSEIEADVNTQKALNAFNNVLNKASKLSSDGKPVAVDKNLAKQEKKYKEDLEKLHKSHQKQLYEH
jgi:hypothetical protein